MDRREAGWRGYAAATATVGAVAFACLQFRATFAPIDVAMLLLLAVVVVAARSARGPAVYASLLAILAFDFAFVPPYYTLAVHEGAYVVTFATMLIVALIMGGLTARLRAEAGAVAARERRLAALYELGRALAGARTPAEVAEVTARHVERAAGTPAAVALRGAAGALEGGGPPFDRPRVAEAAAWVLDHGEAAGTGTAEFPDAGALLLPVGTPLARHGVLAITAGAGAGAGAATERRGLELLAGQAGLALERLALARKEEAARLAVEAERLRTALLSSLSHDLRTPLAGIEGAGTALASDAERLTPVERRELAETVVEESRRMTRLVANLLDMIRLESGALAVHRNWQPLEEPLGVALLRLEGRLADHPVEVALPPDLPLVSVDELLLEQVFVNLLENAAKYTRPGTPIRVSAWRDGAAIVVEVADRGPGVAAGEADAVFRKFHRAPGRHVEDGRPAPGGAGLGLTICRGIVTAHGGRIWVEPAAGGGAAFRFTLPLEAAPPSVDPDAALAFPEAP